MTLTLGVGWESCDIFIIIYVHDQDKGGNSSHLFVLGNDLGCKTSAIFKAFLVTCFFLLFSYEQDNKRFFMLPKGGSL